MKPCSFRQQPPVVHRHVVEPAWFQVACISNECRGREMRTIRCGREAEAEKIWDDRVVSGEEALEVTVKGSPIRLSKAERDDLLGQLAAAQSGQVDVGAKA